MTDCIFCKIVQGEIPADVVYEDEHCLAFRDIQPKAPIHLLVIPRKHVVNLDDLKDSDRDLISHMMLTIPRIARQQGLTEGYRTVTNNGKGGGQEVFHLHFHILGGGKLHAL
ncbi:histidine triad nucleotide-binding protein [Sansalvadorimonas verongulae]|uniref:histidine triad nucleotide-binding protein n=1 Tax=Sansalvadorimonas verongulae TaxID=2172824 RepID=UPI0012BC0167|nr:histidine triad nucleotide-binding protein [Sansalvadorimonas verongulae]MTI15494.1 histidine triad nucleotide-binding protein [Sansalvadorimonas verongulae]